MSSVPNTSDSPSAQLSAAQKLAAAFEHDPNPLEPVLESLELDDEIRAAALLLPAVRLGQLKPDRVSTTCGGAIAELVAQLLRLSQLPLGVVSADAPPQSEQSEALRRMLLATIADPRLVVVRLAEQLIELRGLKQADERRRRDEGMRTLEIFAPLANRLGVWQLKWELEDLAFRFLEPQRYREIASQLNERRADRERYIANAVGEVSQALTEAGIAAEVVGRPKHIYSIWRKMRAKDLTFERLIDIRAVRILVSDLAACYAALGVIHGQWPYLDGEFDDYIANPKENGYRSLHTAVLGPGNVPLEVQIRTVEMHNQAELGVAAHWRYKETGKAGVNMDARVRWLRQLLEPADAAETADDFVDRIKSEILEERVYVFSPKGDVVDLPLGATPLDFAYHVHTEIGHRCKGAKVNGYIVPLTHTLTTADQVEILTAKQPQPSRDWLLDSLGYLKSSRSRAKLRTWFRQQDQAINRRQGRNMLDRELTKLAQKDVPLQPLAEALKYESVEQLCVALGAGDLKLTAITQQLQRSSKDEQPVRRRARTATANASVAVAGLNELLSQFARCCGPVPPEAITGYITQGRGVTIHRTDCTNLRRLGHKSPDRIMELDWGGADQVTYPAQIIVTAFDRQGLLRDITSLLADEQVSILGTRSSSDSPSLSASIQLEVAVSSLEQLSRVLDRLRQVANVADARRG
jgi:GTP pyrophosphokinase